MAKPVEPQLASDSFSCPHCTAIAHQSWYKLFLHDFTQGQVPAVLRFDDMKNFDVSKTLTRWSEREQRSSWLSSGNIR
jgi:hypothetical protein